MSGIIHFSTATFLSALCLLFLFTPGANAALTVSELAGNWESNSLASGPSAPWWFRANWTVDQEGRVSGTGIEDDDEFPHPFNGIFTSLSDGWFGLSVDGNPNASCSLDSGKTILACTEEWTSDGTANLILGTRRGAAYSNNDLVGEWHGSSLGTGTAHWWGRHNLIVDQDRTFTLYESWNDGQKDSATGKISVTSEGVVIFENIEGDPGDSNNKFVMDSGKTVIIGTGTNDDNGATGIKLAVKKTESYSMLDLVGKWRGHALASGPGTPWWSRYTISISSDGTYSGKKERSDGSVHDNKSGALTISPDGIITCSGTTCDGKREGDLQGVMDADKTVMVFTSTWTDESSAPGTTQIWIFTKDSPNVDPGVMMLLLE